YLNDTFWYFKSSWWWPHYEASAWGLAAAIFSLLHLQVVYKLSDVKSIFTSILPSVFGSIASAMSLLLPAVPGSINGLYTAATLAFLVLLFLAEGYVLWRFYRFRSSSRDPLLLLLVIF